MATTTYNIPEAIKAQDWYCKTKILPHFSPGNGICWSCHQNIYSDKGWTRYGKETHGYSVESAAGQLITGTHSVVEVIVSSKSTGRGNMQLATWGTYRFKADAQKCADEIMEICDELESATPHQILDKARDSNTELHKCFTWDDTEAAEKWRVQEARSVVRNLKIIEVKPDKEPEPTTIRVFYKTDGSSGYKPTKLILNKPDEYKALVERCRSELLAVKQKFQNISEYEEIWEMIN